MTEQEVHERVVDRMLERNKEEFVELFDAAVDRWLDKQFSRFGKWALGGVVAAGFVWLLKLWIYSGGLTK